MRAVVGALAASGLALAATAALGASTDCNPGLGKACAHAGMTPGEALAQAEAERVAAIAADVKRNAQRADAQLLKKYPDESALLQAKRDEVAVVIPKLRLTGARLDELLAQRKHLDEEAEFYVGKPLPPALLRLLQDSDGSFRGIADTFRGLESDIAFIAARHEVEMTRLRQLWAGAPPGSLGLLVYPDPAAHR